MTESEIKALAVKIYEQVVDNKLTIDNINIFPNHINIQIYGYRRLEVNIERALISKFSNNDNIVFKLDRVGIAFYWIREA